LTISYKKYCQTITVVVGFKLIVVAVVVVLHQIFKTKPEGGGVIVKKHQYSAAKAEGGEGRWR